MTSGKRSVTDGRGVALASWGALAGIDLRVTQSRRPKRSEGRVTNQRTNTQSAQRQAQTGDYSPGSWSLPTTGMRYRVVRQMYVSELGGVP